LRWRTDWLTVNKRQRIQSFLFPRVIYNSVCYWLFSLIVYCHIINSVWLHLHRWKQWSKYSHIAFHFWRRTLFNCLLVHLVLFLLMYVGLDVTSNMNVSFNGPCTSLLNVCAFMMVMVVLSMCETGLW
jgi:magnesium-transporting ATPase (P-type)